MPVPQRTRSYMTVTAKRQSRPTDSQGHIRQSRPYKTVKAIHDSQGHIRQSRPKDSQGHNTVKAKRQSRTAKAIIQSRFRVSGLGVRVEG